VKIESGVIEIDNERLCACLADAVVTSRMSQRL
jgi:hypothetical protein